MKTCVVIDSTFYMPKADLLKYQFKIIPLTVNFDDVTYREVNDDGEQAKEVFKRIFNQKKLPTTSQPSGSEIEKVFVDAINEGYERIISLHISSQLSGTMQGVKIIAESVREQYPHIDIWVFDSMAAAQASSLPAIEIAKYINNNGTIEYDVVEDILDYFRFNLQEYFYVDNLDFLAFGGRIPASLASIGNLFGITPVLTLNELGGIEKYKTERSVKKAISDGLQQLADENFTSEDEIYLIGIHIENEAMANKLVKEALKQTKAKVVYKSISNFGIVIGNHLGPKAFGFGWVKRYKD